MGLSLRIEKWVGVSGRVGVVQVLCVYVCGIGGSLVLALMRSAATLFFIFLSVVC